MLLFPELGGSLGVGVASFSSQKASSSSSTSMELTSLSDYMLPSSTEPSCFQTIHHPSHYQKPERQRCWKKADLPLL
jgi:hypothetical protein